MTRLTGIRDYIQNDATLSSLAASEQYAEIAEIMNSKMVTKIGTVTPAWLLTFLGINSKLVDLDPQTLDDNVPDTDPVKNGCAILVNYLQSGNPNPMDFGMIETQMMLEGFHAAGVITAEQRDKVLAKCSYQSPYVVETWGECLTSADEIRQALA